MTSYSVTQSCPTPCNPINCSTPGVPVLHSLPEFSQTYVLWISDAIQPVYPLSSPSLPAFNLSQYQFFLPVSQHFISGSQSIGVSASASLLPMNIQGCFTLGLTGWISLLFKGLSRVFSNTTVHKHQFFGTQPLLCLILTSIHDYWKNHMVCVNSFQSCPTLLTLWTVACQAPLYMGFSRQESWSGLPYPPPGDHSNPRIGPEFPMSAAFSSRFFTTSINTLTKWTFVSQVMSLLFNMLSRLVIAFLWRGKHLLISWLQLPWAVTLEPKENSSITVSIFSSSICHEVMGPHAMFLIFWMLSFRPSVLLSSFTFSKRLFSSS